ncbi:MAG TPA: DUF2500 family protein [Symbiobacteriaceae bacterium]|nr:DUF2500 family protein [Symbiobacteriaceae bacterium]
MESRVNLIGLLLGGLVVICAAIGGYVLWQRSRGGGARGLAPGGGNQPPAQAATVVLGKRTYSWPDRVGYYVTFQTQGAQTVELEVTAEWYGFLNPGDRGSLVLQGGQFGGFHRAG